MGSKIIVFDSRHAWGYQCPEDYGMIGEHPPFRRLVYFQDTCNALSIILSPLIGVIRAIVAIFYLVQLSTKKGKESFEKTDVDIDATKRFIWMQLGRAGLEMLCLGPILGTAVDGVMTLKNKEMLCFKQPKLKLGEE